MAGNRPATLSAQARRDLAKAAAFIASDNPAAARRLREQVVAAARRVGAYPLIGVVRPTLAPEEVRFLMVSDFPPCDRLPSDGDAAAHTAGPAWRARPARPDA
jgi:plasmid stabilization system protein ParE